MTFLTDAYILRQAPRGDYDLAITAYTKELGKIAAVAKGAKKMTSKLRPHLEFFCLTRLMAAPGSGVFRLAGAGIIQGFKTIRQDANRVVYALAYLEAVDLLTPNQSADQELFFLLNNFFVQLDAAADDKQKRLVFNRALYDLLAHLGWRPRLKAGSQKQLTSELGRLVTEAGDKELKSLASLLRQE
ncbi:MAG: DNA repair protein RecO [Candidatus Buchananbacteria bacterium]